MFFDFALPISVCTDAILGCNTVTWKKQLLHFAFAVLSCEGKRYKW